MTETTKTFEFVPRSFSSHGGYTTNKKHQVVTHNGFVVAKAIDRYHAELIADALNRKVPADVICLDALEAAKEGLRKVWPLVSAYELGGRRAAVQKGAKAVDFALTHLYHKAPEEPSDGAA
jgi:hypothetical protein